MAKISKAKVKAYLEHEGEELGNAMKKRIENKDNWSEFKNELAVAIAEYSSNPTQETKQKMYDIMSTNFATNMAFGKDSLEMILEDFGIKDLQLTDNRKIEKTVREANRIAYRRSIYAALGFEFPEDTVERINREWQEKQDRKYGIVRKTKKAKEIEAPKKETKKSSKNGEKLEDDKEESVLTQAIKHAYHKITASVIMAPGEVPPEILAENREMFSKASKDLDNITGELKRARDIIIDKNKASLNNIPEDVEDIYKQMTDGSLDEEGLEKFATTLESKSNEQVIDMRAKLEGLQKQKIEDDLRKLAEANGLEGQELEDEIEYAILDSKVDENGALVLPARSIFSEIFAQNDGNVVAVENDVIKAKFNTYVSVPKVSDLTDDEVLRLCKNFGKLENMDPNSNEYAVAKYFEENGELLPDDAETRKNAIINVAKERIAVERIAEETELRHKTMIAEEIQEQFQNIDGIIAEYDEKEAADGKLDKTDSKKRAMALKLARVKVKSLEKTGLSRIIDDGEKKSKGLLKRAKELLTPDLEVVRNKASKQYEKQISKNEEPDEAEKGE